MSPPSSTAAKSTAEHGSNAGRTWLEPMLHRVAQHPGCIRFPFDAGPRRGHAKPSGLGMVSTFNTALLAVLTPLLTGT